MKEILRLLEQLQYQGLNPAAIFDNWLDLMLYALLGQEDKYMEVVGRLDNSQDEIGSRPIDLMAKAFALLLIEMKKTNEEVLSAIYLEWNIANKFVGQYFTPKSISKLMAQLVRPKGELISDPCCGAGIMLIEACKIMSKQDLEKAIFIAQDIDYTCVKMCALNLLFFNLNSYVIYGDSLHNEYKRIYQTKRSVWGGSIRELSQEEVEVLKPQLEIAKQNNDNQQLSFF